MRVRVNYVDSCSCLYESAACIHDLCNHVIKLIDAGKIGSHLRTSARPTVFQVGGGCGRGIDACSVTAMRPDQRRSRSKATHVGSFEKKV